MVLVVHMCVSITLMPCLCACVRAYVCVLCANKVNGHIFVQLLCIESLLLLLDFFVTIHFICVLCVRSFVGSTASDLLRTVFMLKLFGCALCCFCTNCENGRRAYKKTAFMHIPLVIFPCTQIWSYKFKLNEYVENFVAHQNTERTTITSNNYNKNLCAL